jgi:choline/glycine/proline betaine transport protein
MTQMLRQHSLLIAAILIAGGLIVFATSQGELAERVFLTAQAALAEGTGWLLILIMNAVLVFVVYLAVSPYAKRRLGGPDARPEYSRLDWFGMLFAAGMGIGLLFYSVAEPLQHYTAFLPYMEDEPITARASMEMTFLHWGVHPWAIYALVGLSLAFFHFNRSERLSFEAPLRELAGPARALRLGWIVNLAAVIGTVFGVSTSLGLGATQASAGVGELFGVPVSFTLQFGIIGLVCAAATVSVLAGVGGGIRRFSVLNLMLAFALMMFVLIAGELLFVLKAFGELIGAYVNDILILATWNETFSGTNWQAEWTIFYWSWWISWSPFVGMFIARVSYGRTIREYILGVLLVPSAFNFVWMTIFGGNALYLELFAAPGIAAEITANPDISLFAFLEYLPLTSLTTALAIIVILLFFVTSADSGALVVATLTSNGRDPSWRQRVFWTLAVGGLAASLLQAGGLAALQSATITAGLPFGLLVLALIPALMLALRQPLSSKASDVTKEDPLP